MGRLLTKCERSFSDDSPFISPLTTAIFEPLSMFVKMNSSFDELLELSQKGDNRNTDMLVGDIYGGMDYSKVNFAVDHIAI